VATPNRSGIFIYDLGEQPDARGTFSRPGGGGTITAAMRCRESVQERAAGMSSLSTPQSAAHARTRTCHSYSVCISTLCILMLSACAGSAPAKTATAEPDGQRRSTHLATPTTRQDMLTTAACASSGLDLAMDKNFNFSGFTGEMTEGLLLKNTTRATCQLLGYARIRVTSPAVAMRLTYMNAVGQQQYAVQPVELLPGAASGIVLSRFRCDEGTMSSQDVSLSVTVSAGESLSTFVHEPICYGSTNNQINVSPYLVASQDLPFCLEPTVCPAP